MKIAITSTENNIEGNVDPRFGRAKYFLIYDIDNDNYEFVDNIQNVNALQGAGIQSAEIISKHNVKYVITGHCGPKAFYTLQQAGIKIIVEVEGTLKKAIEKFKKGELKPIDKPDVDSHWM